MTGDVEADAPITGINVTPLVDVVLVILIIFMATAPIIARRAIKVEVPKVAASSKAATEAMAIALAADKTLTLAAKPVTVDELKKTLAAAAGKNPDQAVTISADKTLAYGDVAELLDAVRGAGIKKLGLEVRRK